MKKLLMLLGSFGVVTSSVATVIACNGSAKNDKIAELKKEIQNIEKLLADYEKGTGAKKDSGTLKALIARCKQITNIDEATRALDNLIAAKNSFFANTPAVPVNPVPADPEIANRQGLTRQLDKINDADPILIETNVALNEQSVKPIGDEVKKAIEARLRVKMPQLNIDKLEITTSTNTFAALEDNEITFGQIQVAVKYDRVDLKVGGWNIPYASEYLKQSKTFIDQLEEGITKRASNLKIPNLIPISGVSGTTIGEMLAGLGPILNLAIPSQLPVAFDQQDANYAAITGLFSTLTTMAGTDWNKEITFTKEVRQNAGQALGEMTVKIDIRTNVEKLIKNLMPTLINFKNFISTQNNKELTLNLLKYLKAAPASYNRDGYAEAFTGITHNSQAVVFASNLEVILFNLLEGWKSRAGVSITQGQPLQFSFALETKGTTKRKLEFDLDYLGKTVGSKKYTALQSLLKPAEIFKILFGLAAINQDTKKEIEISGLKIPLPIGSLLGTNLIGSVLAVDTSNTFADHVKITLNKFNAEMQVTTDGETWVQMSEANIRTATQIRIVLLSVEYTLTDKEGGHTIQKTMSDEENELPIFAFIFDIDGSFLRPKTTSTTQTPTSGSTSSGSDS
ncbi:lipoprotein [Williamsoniiplasma lucivorax]|uniref:Lipoprotein n=1 Tax=Williamsoniiplasma lucivorax TaxID=209274 RepID=A0A2S5RER6_9MOLU|nr:lipoprotein [Williamsoniiplasma lucivorax]PPE05804.1 hypothetical protein ELUCI_v1c00920 [Williamsoniiplasma lucivorax]